MDIATIPIEELTALLPTLSEDDLVAAKRRLKLANDANYAQLAQEWRKKQLPENMEKPVAVRVRMTQLQREKGYGGAVALLPDRVPGFRPLNGEDVVCVDLAWPEVRSFIARNSLEITTEPVNRPIVYDSALQANVTRPTEYKRKKRNEPDLLKQLLRGVRPLVDKIQTQLDGSDNPFRDDGIETKAAAQITQQKIKAEVAAADDEAESSAPRRTGRRRSN